MDRETRWDGARRHHDLTSPRREAGLGVLAGVVAFAGLVIWFALAYERPGPGDVLDAVPEEALGRWVTDDARYMDREIFVGRDSIVMFVGQDGPPVRGEVLRVRGWEDGDIAVYAIDYLVVDEEYDLEMHMTGPDHMNLRNPREVLWTRPR